jgi:type I restriction enzyme S subunit
VSEGNSELPAGWASTPLKDLIALDGLFNDGDWVESKDQDPKGDVRLIQLADIGDGVFRYRSERFLTAAKAEELQCTFLRTGDVLISRLADPLGRACIFPEQTKPCVAAVDVCIFRSGSDEVDHTWLMHFINSIYFRNEIELRSSGTTRTRISRKNLGDIEMRVPPLAEQRRIVAKIKTLQERSRRAREVLSEVGPLLEQFRQSVLAAAFRGYLTADWRAAHQNVEPATELLLRICAERRRRWEQAELGKFEAQHQKPPKNWKDKYKEPEPLGDSYLPELPEGWVWSTLGTISVIQGGITLGQKKRPGVQYVSVPYLRVANVQRGYLDLSEVKAIEVTLDCLEQLRLQDGDLLFNEGGDRDKLGRGWVWKSEIEDCIHQNHVFRARLLSHEIIPELISHYANEFGREFFFQRASQTVNLASINKTQLSRLPVPVIPLKEQQVLATLLDAVMQLADELQAQVDVAVSKLDTLDQSILAKAFRGELVPQDPHDEPASVLLERIRAQPRRQAKAPKQTSKLVQTSELAKIASRLEPQQLTLAEVLRTAD